MFKNYIYNYTLMHYIWILIYIPAWVVYNLESNSLLVMQNNFNSKSNYIPPECGP